MRQQTLAAQTGFEKYGRKTKRERFLEEMEQVVPWTELEALVEPHYPKGENGRPPVGLGIMLRMYFLQQWFNLWIRERKKRCMNRPCCGTLWALIWDVRRRRTRLRSCSFRHLLEKHDLGGAMLDAVNRYLESSGHPHHHGHDRGRDDYSCALVDQERERERDPEMHQTRKGKQWFFGLKAHIGVDCKEGMCIRCARRAASVADKHMLPDLLHGEERKVWGDGGYQGPERSDPRSRAERPGYDQPRGQI